LRRRESELRRAVPVTVSFRFVTTPGTMTTMPL
jgi:hypothetical protein